MKTTNKCKFLISGSFTIEVPDDFEILPKELKNVQKDIKSFIYKKLEIYASNSQFQQPEKIRNVRIEVKVK